MVLKDYYSILGLKQGCTHGEVKRAFRRLVRIYHPDVSNLPDAKERFELIVEAYEVLSDPAKRRNYDRRIGAKRKDEELHELRYPPKFWKTGTDTIKVFKSEEADAYERFAEYAQMWYDRYVYQRRRPRYADHVKTPFVDRYDRAPSYRRRRRFSTSFKTGYRAGPDMYEFYESIHKPRYGKTRHLGIVKRSYDFIDHEKIEMPDDYDYGDALRDSVSAWISNWQNIALLLILISVFMFLGTLLYIFLYLT